MSLLFIFTPFLLTKNALPAWFSLIVPLMPTLGILLITGTKIHNLVYRSSIIAAILLTLFLGMSKDIVKPEIIYLTNAIIINTALLWLFGSSLANGRTPLCTRLAMLVHKEMPQTIVTYTRWLTLAWALFFAIQIFFWTGLFFVVPAALWLELISISPPVMIIGFFAADWLTRQFVLPVEDRKNSLRLMINAIKQHRGSSYKTATK